MLKKLGEAMGMPIAGLPHQAASAAPEVAEEEGEEGEEEEEESIVHHTASRGDVEVSLLPTLLKSHLLDLSFMCCLKTIPHSRFCLVD